MRKLKGTFIKYFYFAIFKFTDKINVKDCFAIIKTFPSFLDYVHFDFIKKMKITQLLKDTHY